MRLLAQQSGRLLKAVIHPGCGRLSPSTTHRGHRACACARKPRQRSQRCLDTCNRHRINMIMKLQTCNTHTSVADELAITVEH